MLSFFSHAQFFLIPGTVTRQASLSMGFSRQDYLSGLPCSHPGDLPNSWIKTASLTSPALAGRVFTTNATWEARYKVLIDCWSLSLPTISNPIDWGPPGFFIHGVFQARILAWVPVPFSRASSRPRDQTCVSCVAGRFFTIRPTREDIIAYPPS